MPVAFCRSCHVALQMLELQRKKRFVVVRHGCRREEMKIPKVHKGQREPQDCTKRQTNGKADCSTLLKRITKLKVSIL